VGSTRAGTQPPLTLNFQTIAPSPSFSIFFLDVNTIFRETIARLVWRIDQCHNDIPVPSLVEMGVVLGLINVNALMDGMGSDASGKSFYAAGEVMARRP